jgi:hypothetical protein
MTAVNLLAGVDINELRWVPNPPDQRFGYPIDYDFAVLGCQQDIGRLDLLIRWAPNSYCHFHRHIGATTTLVLEGEHHVIDLDENGQEVAHDVRPAGDYRISPGGDLHMERGGPDGSLVLFAMFEPSGRMFEILDDDRNLIAPVTIDSLLALSEELD